MESVEAKTKDIMPVAFEFKCVPFEGLKDVRLNYASALSLAIVLYWFCALFSWRRCRKKWLTNFVICLLRNSRTANRNLYWYFHRLISLLQMPLRGHLWKRNLLNNRRMVRDSFSRIQRGAAHIRGEQNVIYQNFFWEAFLL